GADVPFCLTGGLARVTGIGEIIQPLPPITADWPMLLAMPETPLSTVAVFAKYNGEHAEPNDLYPAAVSLCPEMETLLNTLARTATACGMTGSGSALWAVFNDEPARDAALQALLCKCWAVEPVDKGVEIEP
ncbi:MAG: hypothetical protein FWD16_03895, partial [Clostridia bacterium]|nr:hypothetical protein [Clostridia bacterium]